MSSQSGSLTFIPAYQARHLLGYGWNRFYRTVSAGEIRTRRNAGERDVKYCREDVERLRQESSLQPAGA
jgi:hypothetical protein